MIESPYPRPKPPAFNANQVYLYFGTLTFLLAIVNPVYYFTDISTSYMMKNQLHQGAEAVSTFRLITAIPVYLAFLFGLIRDRWDLFGMRDRGLLLVFGFASGAVFLWMAFQPVSIFSLYAGVLMFVLSTRFVVAAYQGLISLVGQEKLMSGRLATVWNFVLYIPVAFSAWLSGVATVNLKPHDVFIVLAVLSCVVGLLGMWRPESVFRGAYEGAQARTSTLGADLKRLFRHKAIYAPVIIMFLWNFAPGSQTPLQFYLTKQLHASDAAYANFNAVFTIAFLPTFLVYGYLCTRYPLKNLLFWGTVIAVPQLIPLLFVKTAASAVLLAAPIGLMGGVATAAYYDLAMRSCPPGLQGTLMLAVDGVYFLCQRGSDLLGSKIYESAPTPRIGFMWCVVSITVVYALILPAIKLAPKEIIATADGEENPAINAKDQAEFVASA